MEIKKIMITEVLNGFTKYSHIDGGNNTDDYVFLLSIDEGEKYFSNDKQRVCYITPYGTARGAWTEYDGACWWWLRSPGEPVEFAAHIFTDGDVHIYGNRLSGTGGAVRPALWISLKHREIRKLAQVHTVGGNLGFEPRQTCVQNLS